MDLNAMQAAIRAGYSPKSAAKSGMRNTNRADIQSAIAEAMKARGERTELTADRVVQELKLIAFSDGSEVFPVIRDGKVVPPDVASLTENQRRNISEVAVTRQGVRVARWDKMKALEMLGRHLGMFVDRQEIVGDPNAPLVIVQPPKETA